MSVSIICLKMKSENKFSITSFTDVYTSLEWSHLISTKEGYAIMKFTKIKGKDNYKQYKYMQVTDYKHSPRHSAMLQSDNPSAFLSVTNNRQWMSSASFLLHNSLFTFGFHDVVAQLLSPIFLQSFLLLRCV